MSRFPNGAQAGRECAASGIWKQSLEGGQRDGGQGNGFRRKTAFEKPQGPRPVRHEGSSMINRPVDASVLPQLESREGTR